MSLADHAVTLCSYLTEYKEEPDYNKYIKTFQTQVCDAVPPDKLIQALQNSIKVEADPEALDMHRNDIFPGTLHCETVLAAIGLYPDLAIKDGDMTLTKIGKVLVLPTISHNQSDSTLAGIGIRPRHHGIKALLSSLLQAFLVLEETLQYHSTKNAQCSWLSFHAISH